MNQRYTISQLAKLVELPTTTIRYYERRGLLKPEGRSSGNYRLYGDASLNKIQFIRAAQATGFTLEDTKALLTDGYGGVPTCGSVQRLVEDRLVDIEERLKNLQHVRRVLKAALGKCRKQKRSDCCHVVAGLSASE